MAISIAAPSGAGDDSGDRIHEAQALLLRMGQLRFGSPIPEVGQRIRSIQELKQLEKLFIRLMEAVSWQDLFSFE